MKRVLICDDEIKICRLLIKLVDWGALGLEIAATAQDGTDAFALIRELQPDIVITDISMPGLDGIELIRKSKELYPDIHFVIISGYKQFDYAHNAIKFGVEDYLLKPIEKEELLHVLQKITSRFAATRQQSAEIDRLHRKLESSMLRLKSQALPALLEGGTAPSRSAFNAQYGTRLSPTGFLSLLIKPAMAPDHITDAAHTMMLQKCRQIAEQILGGRMEELLSAVHPKGVYLLLNGSPELLSDISLYLRQIAKNILMLNDIFPDIAVTIGISSISAEFSSVPRQIEEATAAALEQLTGYRPQLCYYRDISPQKRTTPEPMPQNVRFSFFHAMEILDTDGVLDILQSYRRAFSGTPYTGQAAYAFCLQVYEQFLAAADSFSLNTQHVLPIDFLTVSLRYRSFHEVFQLLLDLISDCIAVWRLEKKSENSRPIRIVKQYIQKHFAAPITLEDLGTALNFNPNYLSQLFKQETGVNLKDYLLEVRMTEAKNLLQHTDMVLPDVALAVSYNDPKHFSKLFKKFTGLSPKEYRKLYHI